MINLKYSDFPYFGTDTDFSDECRFELSPRGRIWVRHPINSFHAEKHEKGVQKWQLICQDMSIHKAKRQGAQFERG